jgi:ribosomal protein S18 acetylase RimI-like enzyme
MTGEIVLRPATPADAKTLASLWMATFPDKFGRILGRQGEEILYDWFCLSQRHLQTTTLLEVDGLTAGFIVLETASAPQPDSGRWLWRALQLHNGIFGALRSFILMILLDNGYQPGRDEVYIELLGVDPKWRGRGFAGQLMAHAERTAWVEQVSQLTLNVVCDNAPAIALYRKLNFEVAGEYESKMLNWLTGHSGYYKMVKRLKFTDQNRA